MKKAVVTMIFGDAHRRVSKLSYPTFRRYANRIGADIIVIERKLPDGVIPHWEKLQLRELLNYYERLLWLDVDMIVRDDTPDLFEIVPIGTFGAFEEALFAHFDYKKAMARTRELLNVPQEEWNGFYFNSGVMVLDRAHRELFEPPKQYFHEVGCPEQTYLNVRFNMLALPFQDITYKFNCIRGVPPHRSQLTSYIIHYAGWFGRRDVQSVTETMLQQMKRDLQDWNEEDWTKPRPKVFGIGLSRTGTMSLTTALNTLGYSTRHYPFKIEFMDQFDAAADIPVALWYKELDRRYPGSKFILTVREMESWLSSMEWLFNTHHKWVSWPSRWWGIINENDLKMYGTTSFDRGKMVEAYKRHHEDVFNYFKNREHDLLVFNPCAGDGWEKLCGFLGKPVPQSPFPKINSRW